MSMRISSVVLAVLLAVTLSACGGPLNGDEQPSEPGGSVSNSALPPSGKVFPTPSASPKYQAGPITITGRPEPGVESGCLVMQAADGKLYLLLGGDRRMLQSGQPVIVRGTPNPGLMTTCQQGLPFEVTDVQPG